MEVNYKKIGERIQKIRKMKGLSVVDLADKIHFTPKSVVLAEYGQTNLSVDFLMPLCTALDVSPNDLLMGEYTVSGKECNMEKDLLVEELNNLLQTLKGEAQEKEGTVIKETEVAIEDIRQMVVKMKEEARENSRGTAKGAVGHSHLSRHY